MHGFLGASGGQQRCQTLPSSIGFPCERGKACFPSARVDHCWYCGWVRPFKDSIYEMVVVICEVVVIFYPQRPPASLTKNRTNSNERYANGSFITIQLVASSSAAADPSRAAISDNRASPYLLERFTHRSQTGQLPGVMFPAPDSHVDIHRIKLDRAGAATSLFRRDQDGSAATKGIEHQTAALRAILYRVGNKCHRLYSRMHRELVHSTRSHGIDPVIIPHIASVPAILAEFKSVDVRRRTVLPDEYHLVLGAIERAHPGVALVPDAHILQLGVVGIARGQHFPHMTPVHADLVN